MGFTPPPEKLATFNASALLTTAFLSLLRGATFENMAIRGADGVLRYPTIDTAGRWSWTDTGTRHLLVTAATLGALMLGTLQTDGSILYGEGRRFWLCDTTLADGTQLALAVLA